MKLFYDLHLHSCLSPCGDMDMTPANMAAMCRLAGLDVVALTDHNTAGNCRPFVEAARQQGLLALSGMELTTAEEVHVICLFATVEAAEAFSAHVYGTLPPIENDIHIFGPQLFMDAGDQILGEEPHLLSVATTIGVYEVCPLVSRFGGVCFPAHIDRPSYSLLSQLGLWDPDIPFPLAELSPHCPPELPKRRDLTGLSFLTNSDAHTLDAITDAAHSMEVPERTEEAVIAWLRCGGG